MKRHPLFPFFARKKGIDNKSSWDADSGNRGQHFSSQKRKKGGGKKSTRISYPRKGKDNRQIFLSSERGPNALLSGEKRGGKKATSLLFFGTEEKKEGGGGSSKDAISDNKRKGSTTQLILLPSLYSHP